jgi:hypothetical protein
VAPRAQGAGRPRHQLPLPDPPAGRPHQPDAPAVDGQAKLAGRWVRVVGGLGFGGASGELLAPAGLPAGDRRRRTSTVVKDLGKVRLTGSTSSTAGAVGFLTPPRLPWLGRGRLGGRLTPGDGVGLGPARGRPGSSRRRPGWSGSWRGRCWPTPGAASGCWRQATRRSSPSRRPIVGEVKGAARYYDAGDPPAVGWSCASPQSRVCGHRRLRCVRSGPGGRRDRGRRAGQGPAGRLDHLEGHRPIQGRTRHDRLATERRRATRCPN